MANTNITLDNNLTSTYFHIHVGSVDVKVKIVAIGQASEAVSVFCTPIGGTGTPWCANSETLAQDLLEYIRQSFDGEIYKSIPLMSNTCAGIKIHRTCREYSWQRRRFARQAAEDSVEIFLMMHEILQLLAERPERARMHNPNVRGSFHKRVSSQALRNEIARIIEAGTQVDSKINSIVRLIERQGTLQ